MKRYLAALAIGGAVFGTVLASAASLGTITDGTLGEADGVVAACQDADTITADYNVAWDATSKRYEVTDVQLNGLTAACDGKAVKVALLDANDASVANNGEAGVIAQASGIQTIAVTGASDRASAEEVEGIRVVIYGE